MDSHLNRNLPPIQRGRGTCDRMEGQAGGRSVFASRVMTTEGPSPLGPPLGQGHLKMDARRMAEQTSRPFDIHEPAIGTRSTRVPRARSL